MCSGILVAASAHHVPEQHVRCAASTMFSIAGANMPSGKVDVNGLAGDDGLGSGGIVSLPSLLAALCEAGRAASTLAPILLPHHLELNVGVWIGVPPLAAICVMGFRL
jgi:hypothetical protein